MDSERYPPSRERPRLPWLLAALGLRWAGEAGLVGRRLDSGLALFAGWEEAPEIGEVRKAWAAATPVDHARFQAVFFQALLRRHDEIGIASGDDLRGALAAGRLDLPATDLAFGLTAVVLLRAWAGGLGRFATSGVSYLLDQFVRRSGRILVEEKGFCVVLEPASLDVVLRLYGYDAPIELHEGTVVRFGLKKD